MESQLKLISGRTHLKLAQSVAALLQINLTNVSLGTFANSEICVSIDESVRGDDIFILQSHFGDVNTAIMEQAIMIDAAKRASAKSITAVCPFMAYARQDRKAGGREPISARLVVDILANAGADRILSIDLHTGQIQGFMDGPFDHLVARPLFVAYLAKTFTAKDLVIVSPDAGRVKAAERYSTALNCEIAIIHKHRSVEKKNAVEAKHLIGEVKGKICILTDDMIDTGGTICAAADLLAARGAKAIYAITTHGLFSGAAKERIKNSFFNKIITTDTVPQEDSIDKVEVLSVAPIIANAIKAIHNRDSVSSIFDGDNQF